MDFLKYLFLVSFTSLLFSFCFFFVLYCLRFGSLIVCRVCWPFQTRCISVHAFAACRRTRGRRTTHAHVTTSTGCVTFPSRAKAWWIVAMQSSRAIRVPTPASIPRWRRKYYTSNGDPFLLWCSSIAKRTWWLQTSERSVLSSFFDVFSIDSQADRSENANELKPSHQTKRLDITPSTSVINSMASMLSS